jgi:hypothetical protein
MGGDATYTLLEQLDLAVAAQLAMRSAQPDYGRSETIEPSLPSFAPTDWARWIAGMLGLRGFVVHQREVEQALAGESTRFRSGQQEHALVGGLQRVLLRVRDRAAAGRSPDGWFLVDLWKDLTRDIARFRGNVLRRDLPWDSVLYVPYPEPAELRPALDRFEPAHHYRDLPQIFDRLHPVRRAFRVLWRFARLAPFPDLNLMFAFLAMDSYLLAHGYPLVVPQPGDRELLVHLIGGPPPVRVQPFERRMLEAVAGAQAASE